jgi:hypothetical protein
MFTRADRTKLRAAGDPLPGAGPFTVYRGVAGRGPARRVRGLSWTDDVEKAAWFAQRLPGLSDPAIYRVIVEGNEVFACNFGRGEREFIVYPKRRPQRLDRGSLSTLTR